MTFKCLIKFAHLYFSNMGLTFWNIIKHLLKWSKLAENAVWCTCTGSLIPLFNHHHLHLHDLFYIIMGHEIGHQISPSIYHALSLGSRCLSFSPGWTPFPFCYNLPFETYLTHCNKLCIKSNPSSNFTDCPINLSTNITIFGLRNLVHTSPDLKFSAICIIIK